MTFIIVALIVALFVAVVLATMRSGPRVTTIEHRRDERDEKGDGK